MRKLLLLLIGTGLLTAACRLNGPSADQPAGKTVTVAGRWPEPNTSLTVEKLGGSPDLAAPAIGAAGSFSFQIKTETPLLLLLRGQQMESALLAFPGRQLEVSPSSDFQGLTFAEKDAANRLYQANKQAFLADLQQRTGFFLRAYPQQVRPLIDSLARQRARQIEAHRNQLTQEEADLLRYEVQRRKHAFLFHYGKNIRKLPPKHVFYDFVEEIDADDPTGIPSNLGLTVLQKWDILYRRPRLNMGTNRQFFDFLGRQYEDENRRQFYQSLYLRELLDGNNLLAEHLEILDVSDVASMEYHLGEENPYRDLYRHLLKPYYETRQGKRATDVTARNPQGEEVRLSDFDGKVIYIDSWASWCAPCMAELPYLHELAEAYRAEPDFVILTMSFDYNFNRWLEALAKQPSYDNIVPLFVEGGIDSEYAQTYLISSIPDYALLDRNRGIITLDAPHPSEPDELRRLIDRALTEK